MVSASAMDGLDLYSGDCAFPQPLRSVCGLPVATGSLLAFGNASCCNAALQQDTAVAGKEKSAERGCLSRKLLVKSLSFLPLLKVNPPALPVVDLYSGDCAFPQPLRSVCGLPVATGSLLAFGDASCCNAALQQDTAVAGKEKSAERGCLVKEYTLNYRGLNIMI